MLGSWNVDVSVGKMPQKVASAFGDLKLIGAEYTPIAYLGSQQVNGVNHAVLAEQLVLTGRDTKNVVLMIFNEKDDGVALVNIERVVENGGKLGGINVDVKTEIPDEAMEAFDSVFGAYVGAKIEPFALVATQVTKGMNYVFAATVTPVVENPVTGVTLVTVNQMTNDVAFVDLLTSKHDVLSLGYAFTWLRQQNTSAPIKPQPFRPAN